MKSIKHESPEDGLPVVWCAVERNNGHTTAGLAEWSDELEAQLRDADLEAFWTPAPLPYTARIRGAIESTRSQLLESEIQVHTLDNRLNNLQALLEDIEYGSSHEQYDLFREPRTLSGEG